MSGDLDLEQRYRRVLRLLPGYYRDQWEEDMVAAFLDSWLTGDPDEDSVTMEYDRPSRPEVAVNANANAQIAIIVAGQTWGVPFTSQPLTNGQFVIAAQSKDQALQLRRILLKPA